MLSFFERESAEPNVPVARGASVARKATAPDRALSSALSEGARVLFLDIETTGLSWFYDEITIVGWLVDGKYKVMVASDDPRPLLEDLAAANVLVTFNGTLFDLRFLRKSFGEDVVIPGVHVDLRYLARRVGYSGGQKSIERELGINLRDGLEDIDGAAAVLLWHDYLRGNDRALDLLIRYNRSDVLAMTAILDHVLSKLENQQDFWLRLPIFSAEIERVLGASLPFFQKLAPDAERPFRNFDSTFGGSAAYSARIVGIDLTGSERRGSGWCLLNGAVAEISTKFTDDEMFDAVVAARPDLVSIDSPLSLPFGRNSVSDNDPTRAEFGIMRRCERTLKRRGINVYPSLLPSMQGLTYRGMSLAVRLRQMGFAVIESYPGAAQDIMGIPRKGAGIEYLKRGLAEFGIRGSYVDGQASHDELDAITAALVGSFFLAGKYEALRGPTEGALIVPDLKSSDETMLVVGISGHISAGKTTGAQMLESQHFAYSRFSMVIDDEIRAIGGHLDRKTRQAVGDEIHHVKGQRWLCEKVLEKVAGRSLVVIDGLRFPEDHAFFTETFGSRFLHVHIQAATDVRRLRYEAIKQGMVLFDDADKQPVESKIHLLGELAHVIVTNDGPISELEEKLELAVKTKRKDAGCQSQSS